MTRYICAVAAILVLALGANAAAAKEKVRPKIGVQLYSVRDDCAKDFPTTIAAIGRMGYEGVEFAGYYGRSAEELRKMLDDAGLKCCGTHIGLEALLGDNLMATVKFNQTLGNKFLIVPGLSGEHTKSREAWLETARIFNEIAAKLKPYGMHVGYHNHTGEVKDLDGEKPFDTFFGHTSKDVVMQMDIGHMVHGGADPVAYLNKYPGRALTVHVKEWDEKNPSAFVGEGSVQWKQVLPVLYRKSKTEWLTIEHEVYTVSPMESVEKDLANLRKLLTELRLR
jgi:sugar phosphate isomerase/epimerase